MKEMKWKSFDGQLQKLAEQKGARIIREKVAKVAWENARPQLKTRDGVPQAYDLVTVNSPALKIFETLGLGYERPATTKTAIREYYLGEEVISQTLGNSMHVFLLNIPRLEFAALVPKGDYVTMCLLGEEIDAALLDAFVNSPEVRACMPSDWDPNQRSCQCSPRINIQGVKKPYADRVLFIGDCGITRLYKDGIGAAFRTAKAAASTAIFEGISEEAFRRHYMPLCRSIKSDNLLGKVTFAVTQQIQKMRFARKAVLRMTVDEQQKEGPDRRMSGVLWDMFSGSAPYRDIFLRTLRPAFLGKFGWALAASLLPFNRHTKRQTVRKKVLQ
jgi:flavin-dependent dehydrogenase